MKLKPGAPRALHIHGAFAAELPSVQRSVRLMDAFGGRLDHSVVSASGDWSAIASLPRGIKVRQLAEFPQVGGMPSPGRLQKLARAMRDFDLLLTYGRGAIDAALAHTMFSKVYPLPPLIHHEDGSDETARQRRGLRSKWYRRVGLGKAAGLVVPTETMEHVALIDWQQPLGRVKTIRDGVDLKRFSRLAKPDAVPRLLKRPGEGWIACMTAAGDDADVLALVDALSRLPSEWHLVLATASSANGSIGEAVARTKLDHRVHFAPAATDYAVVLALADVVACPRQRDVLPIAMVAAMAAARPVVAFGAEEVRILSPDNAELLLTEGPAATLARLAGDSFLRQQIGSANRERAETERDEAAMVAAYRRLYSSAIGRDGI